MNYNGLVRFSIQMVWFLALPLLPLACSDGKGNAMVNAGANADPHDGNGITTVNAGANLNPHNVDPHADTPITATSVPRIQKGITIAQLREAVRDSTPWRYRFLDEDNETLEEWMKVARDLEPPLQHLFTTARNGDIITCVAAQLFDSAHSLKITFVFRNGTLEKFMPDPPYQWTQSGPGSMKLVTDSEARIEEILQSDGLSDEDFITYVVENAERRIAKRRKHSEPLLPLAQALAGAMMGPIAPRMKVDFQHRERFDGLKVGLGMSLEEVNDLFGDPIMTQESESGTRRIYSSTVGDVRLYKPVLVEFTDDQVQRVFGSYDFIDLELYR